MPSGPKATTGSEARSYGPPVACVMPGTARWFQVRPPSAVRDTEIPTAPPSEKRESWAAAIATVRSSGDTATCGSTTVSASEPPWVGTSWLVTTPCSITLNERGDAAAAGRASAQSAVAETRTTM